MALFILALVALAQPPPEPAQVNDLEPFWVVLTRDTELRCGDSPSWYAIANLKQGQLLKVNAESFDWYRVAYPKGTRVWIDTRDARIIEEGADRDGPQRGPARSTRRSRRPRARTVASTCSRSFPRARSSATSGRS
ncbi:MAG: hypothetical protein ACFHWZ_06765 [Phycisphaerales bacterium]